VGAACGSCLWELPVGAEGELLVGAEGESRVGTEGEPPVGAEREERMKLIHLPTPIQKVDEADSSSRTFLESSVVVMDSGQFFKIASGLNG